MLNIPEEVKSLFKADGIYKNFHVHFPNGECRDLHNPDIVQESVQFTESLCSQQYFKFGLSESSQIEFTAVDIPNILGAEIECAIEVDCASLGDEWKRNHPYDPSTDWLLPQPSVNEIQAHIASSPASIVVPTGDVADFYSFDLGIEPVRSGSGNPSPTNIREISGTDGTSLTINNNTYEFEFPELLYYGKVDLVRGKIVKQTKLIDLGTLNWNKTTVQQTGKTYFRSYNISDAADVDENNTSAMSCCSHYLQASARTFPPSADNRYCMENPAGTTSHFIEIYDTSKALLTTAQFKEAMSGVQLVYELKDYVEYDAGVIVSRLTGGTSWSIASTADKMKADYAIGLPDRKHCYRIPYGRFKVDACPRNHGAMAFRKITAYTEEPFKNQQYINGQYPNKLLKISPYDWAQASIAEEWGWASGSANSTYCSIIPPLNQGLCMSGGGHVELYGISAAYNMAVRQNMVFRFRQVRRTSGEDKLGVYAFRINFNKSEMDDYADHFYEAALASLPSGDFSYETQESTGTTVKGYANTQQAVATLTGMFKPCYYIAVRYVNDSNTDKMFYRVSKPVFFESGELLIIDLLHLDDFVYCAKVPSGYRLPTEIEEAADSQGTVEVHVSVPCVWKNEAYWDKVTNSGTDRFMITDWATDVPFGSRTTVYRPRASGTTSYVRVWHEMLDDSSTIPRISVLNTLKFKKDALGDYYTYANAASPHDLTEGILELTGEFLKVNRTGGQSFFKMSENQTLIPVQKSGWMEFWWDENDVESIGTVKATFTESDEEQSAEFPIGNGESVYVMDNNSVLNEGGYTATDIQNILNEYFVDEAAVVNFTPVDCGMKGLPYLEVGDHIRLTAEDGETVDTYILEQTITGIQNLKTTFSSVNGELLEVIDDGNS